MSAAEIASKLQDDYRRMLKEYGRGMDATPDPVLAAFFRTIAARIEAVATHAQDVLPQEMLDRLVTALGIPEKRSSPAQTVVRIDMPSGSDFFEPFTSLLAQSANGDRMVFRTDVGIVASVARIAFAAVYEEGALIPLECGVYPKEIQDRYSRDAVPTRLGPNPFILIALDVNADTHLDRHGLFFDLQPDAQELTEALQREIWCFVSDSGEPRSEYMMRSLPANAGVRQLDWLVQQSGNKNTDRDEERLQAQRHLEPGFYGSRAFCFPGIPQDKRLTAVLPKPFQAPFGRMFGTNLSSAFSVPRAWLKIALPRGFLGTRDRINHVWLNTVTASNVDIFDETVPFFSENGAVIPVSSEGGMNHHLVRVLSIKSDTGREYVPAEAPVDTPTTGRFRFVRGRLELIAGRARSGDADQYANVSLLISDGVRGNSVMPGGVRGCTTRNLRPKVRIDNAVQAAGGTDSVPYQEGFAHFADMIRSRERLVTRLDIELFVRSIEPRIQDVTIAPLLERRPGWGLQRVYAIKLGVRKDDFTEPTLETELLANTISSELHKRSPIDIQFHVSTESS